MVCKTPEQKQINPFLIGLSLFFSFPTSKLHQFFLGHFHLEEKILLSEVQFHIKVAL